MTTFLRRVIGQTKKYRVYRGMMISFIILVLIAVLLVSALLTALYAGNAFRESEKRTAEQMEAVNYATSYIYSQIDSVVYALNTDTSIIRFLTLSQKDPVAKYLAGRCLARYKLMNACITNISVINLHANIEVNSFNTMDNIAFFKDNYDAEGCVVADRCIYPYVSDKTRESSVISVLFPSMYGSGGIIIDLDAELFRGLLRSQSDASVFFTAKDGHVVLSLSDLPENIDLQDLQNARYTVAGGKRCFVSSYYIDDFGWTAYRLEPVSSMLSSFGEVFRNMFFVSFAVAILGMCVSVLVTSRVYDPIMGLLEKTARPLNGKAVNELESLRDSFTEMTNRSANAEKTLKRLYLRILLYGGNDIPGELFEQSEEFLPVAFDELTRDEEQKPFHLYTAVTVAREYLAKALHCETVANTQDALLLLCFQGQEQAKELPLALEELRSFLSDRYAINVTMALGDVARSPVAIQSAIALARSRLEYSWYLGNDIIMETHTKPITAREDMGKLWEQALETGNAREFLDIFGELPPEENKKLLLSLMAERIPEISDCLTFAEATERILDYFERRKDKNAHHAEDKNAQVAQRIQQYIEENYANEALSMQTVSDVIGLSVGYIGKIYKAAYGINLTNGLTRIRMEKAKKLLLESNATITEIAQQVGISNAAYFSTLFRNAFGISPSEMRETNKGV